MNGLSMLIYAAILEGTAVASTSINTIRAPIKITFENVSTKPWMNLPVRSSISAGSNSPAMAPPSSPRFSTPQALKVDSSEAMELSERAAYSGRASINCRPAPTKITTNTNMPASKTKSVAINAAQVGAPLFLRLNITGETVMTMINAIKKALKILFAELKKMTTTPRLARPTRNSKEVDKREFEFINRDRLGVWWRKAPPYTLIWIAA